MPIKAKKEMVVLFTTVIEQDINMLDAAKYSSRKVPKKADAKEEKDGDTDMEDVKFPRLRRFNLDKFLDQLEGTRPGCECVVGKLQHKHT